MRVKPTGGGKHTSRHIFHLASIGQVLSNKDVIGQKECLGKLTAARENKWT